MSFSKDQVCTILKNAFEVADSDGSLTNNCISANKAERGVIIISLQPGFNPELSQELLDHIFSKQKYKSSFSDRMIVVKKRSVL